MPCRPRQAWLGAGGSEPAYAVPHANRTVFPCDTHVTASAVPPEASCGSCDAVCCRLTVVLQETDRVPSHLTTYTDAGLHVMARDEEGWCVAIDAARMCCSVYETRPDVCRRFVMAGPYCREVRAEYTDQTARGIPLTLY